MIVLLDGIDSVVEPISDDRRRECRGTRRDRIFVDLPAQPTVQVRGLAGQLKTVASADEVGFAFRLVLPADHYAPMLESAHPVVQVEDVRACETLCSRHVGSRCDAVTNRYEEFISSHSGQRVFLRVQQHVHKHAVLRRQLVCGQVSGNIEASRETSQFPGVSVGSAHDFLETSEFSGSSYCIDVIAERVVHASSG